MDASDFYYKIVTLRSFRLFACPFQWSEVCYEQTTQNKIDRLLAAELGITLQFLPSYSPNLNLIERLWKFVKKKSLNNVYYETFDEFVEGITECLERVENDYKSELTTLMQPNFQDIKKVQLMAL